MLSTISHLLSLIRFSHTLFALPFALMAAVLAWWMRAVDAIASGPRTLMGKALQLPFPWESTFITVRPEYSSSPPSWAERILMLMNSIRWQELLGILLCMVFARSAAMAFNRLVDRRIDAENPRTAGRHIPAGVLSVAEVTAFTIACVFAFIASTLLFLPNRLPLYLSVPVLLFLCGYSYCKRFTSLAHFWLGAALAMSPVAVWIALRGEVVLQYPGDLSPALVLGGAVLAWVSGFDILYACQDFEFDRNANLHSVPVALGIGGALRLAAGCHALTVVLLAALPVVYPALGGVYYLGVVAVAALLLYEHWLVKPDDLDRVNTAFFHVNAVISIGLLVVTCVDLLLL